MYFRVTILFHTSFGITLSISFAAPWLGEGGEGEGEVEVEVEGEVEVEVKKSTKLELSTNLSKPSQANF